MAYQSIYTGQNIDNGIAINDTQNDRLTNLENKDTQFNTTINNLTSEINGLKNKVDTNTSNITSLQNKTIPISQGGTGATTVNQAMSNLGGHMLPPDGI